MRRKKISLDATASGFPRSGFRAVFTELGMGPLVGLGIGPRASGAVKTLDLIKRE
jgi:hypothetical protein